MVNALTILVFYLVFCAGCAVSVIVKDCKEIHDDPKFVCKTIKPWE